MAPTPIENLADSCDDPLNRGTPLILVLHQRSQCSLVAGPCILTGYDQFLHSAFGQGKDFYARTRYQCGHGFQVVSNYFDGKTQLFTPAYYGDLPLRGIGTFSSVVIAVPGFHSRYDLLSKEHAFCSPECWPGIRVMKRLIFSSSTTPSSSSSSNRLSISSERQDLNNAILFLHHCSHHRALPVHRRHGLHVVWPH